MNIFTSLTIKIALASICTIASVFSANAQQSKSTSVVRKSASTHTQPVKGKNLKATSTPRLNATDADLAWMKVVYRSLNLENVENAALYYPEHPINGTENLFSIIMKLLAKGEVTAYEYLDGYESFTDEYRLTVGDMLDRFHINYTPAKGSTDKRPLYEIADADMPSTEVLGYYIIERWEFDRREGRMRTYVDAICPVLHRSEEFGYESVKYPMFWIKYNDIKPYLCDKLIFTDDDNNLAKSTYNDFFTLGLYKGEIYKTRNLRNKSMAQLYPDADERKHAADSIERRLAAFNKSIWVPSLEELEAQAAANAMSSDSINDGMKERKHSIGRVASKRPSKDVKAKKSKSSGKRSTPPAMRSVRNRKK